MGVADGELAAAGLVLPLGYPLRLHTGKPERVRDGLDRIVRDRRADVVPPGDGRPLRPIVALLEPVLRRLRPACRLLPDSRGATIPSASAGRNVTTERSAHRSA